MVEPRLLVFDAKKDDLKYLFKNSEFKKELKPSKRPFEAEMILAGIMPFGFDFARHSLCGGLHASRNQLTPSLFDLFEIVKISKSKNLTNLMLVQKTIDTTLHIGQHFRCRLD